MTKRYMVYWYRMIRYAFTGSWKFYLILGCLSFLVFCGVRAYLIQFSEGFIVTNMTDQISWGAYIANFTYLVGVAAAAVLLVYPSYIYHKHELKEVVLFGELLAVCAIIMCLLFIAVDLGRIDRFWHVIPGIGKLNFPTSILAWDVVVLNVYLLLNLHIPGYILYRRYLKKDARGHHYLPFVYLSIVWAVSIHTVTAFLYSGFAGRPYWNSAILAPRFLVSAFASGPAILIIIFHFIKKLTGFPISPYVVHYLKKVMKYALLTNLFFLGCEIYKEFYTDSQHVASARYLFFGLHGHKMLVPYIWTGITIEVSALFILLFPKLRDKWLLYPACVFIIIGIWIEKGMGLLIPGFIPSTLGDINEYSPSTIEFFVCLGIWSLGVLLYILLSKVAIAIETGKLSISEETSLRPY